MIGIFICTYMRPVLEDCLRSVIASIHQSAGTALEGTVEIHVIDNDQLGSGRAAFDVVANDSDAPMFYHQESTPGISSARNRCLEIACGRVDWLLFIDDDETVEQEWFGGYQQILSSPQADAYVGLVETVYPDYVQADVRDSGLHDRSRRLHLSPITFGACNNCALSMAFIEQHRLRFDDRYNQMMGEDSDLFERIHRLGGRILWNDRSTVHEILVPERATREWVFKRYTWVGETYALRKQRYLSPMGRKKELVQSSLNMAVAWTLSALCLLIPAQHVKFRAFFLRNRAKVRTFLAG